MKKIILLLLVFSLFNFNVVAEEKVSYKASEWALEELKKAEETGIIPQMLLEKDLTMDITRAEFAAVSVKLYEYLSNEKVTVTEKVFDDTDDEYVLKAHSLGVTTGISKTEFAPYELLTREQASVMLTRVYKKIVLPDWSPDKDSELSLEYEEIENFSDDSLISDWAKESVYFMVSEGIIKGVGDNKFAPKNITEEEKLSGYANASREQAIIMAFRMTTIEGLKKQVASVDPYVAIQKTPIINNDENAYTIAFIGGSLTEGGELWINETKKLMKEKMPDKEIFTINAGKGGTGSDFGAARFLDDVGKYNPDMVFIEFTVNDYGATETGHKMYIESIIRQCAKLKKVPSVIILHAPRPVEKNSEGYRIHYNGIAYKNQVAKHYGVKTIDVYDYMQRDYDTVKEEKNYNNFDEYLQKLYSKKDGVYDVHGGYEKYAKAIREAFSEDYEACMAKPKDVGVLCSTEKKIVEATYNQIPATSSRIKYGGTWEKYTVTNKYYTSDSKATIADKHYGYPFFTEGIMQIMNEVGSIEFKTSAEAFCLNYPSSTAGCAVDIFIDGNYAGSTSCNSQYHGVNYIGRWISLPNDGKEHTVFMSTDPTASNYVFRFGSIIERNTK